MFHIRESRTGPDNVLNSKLRWLQNLKRHLNIDTQHELWIWLDLICVPQANRENQKKAIASLCYYANLCSRFIPLVRDKNEWIELYGDDCAGFDDRPRCLYYLLQEDPANAVIKSDGDGGATGFSRYRVG